MHKEIKIPKSLQEFHGKKTSMFSIILVYLCSVTISLVITFYALPKNFPIWKTILFVIATMDIAGGIIANFTNSTNQYYLDKRKLRIPFISLHIIHPILFIILFPQESSLFIFMGVFTLLSCFILNAIRNLEIQRLIAIFLVTCGITILFILPCDTNFLRLLPILFFLKLILGFSVKHVTTTDKT